MTLRCRGTTTVEFALAGMILFAFVLGVVEVGRAFYMTNVLGEVTRRGVRVATVCSVGSAWPRSVAIMDRGDGTSAYVDGLTVDHLVIDYLDDTSTVIPDPRAVGAPTVAYVRARVVGYHYRLHMPFVNPAIPAPEFPATLPRESLGLSRTGTPGLC
jgi:hypothetical protein